MRSIFAISLVTLKECLRDPAFVVIVIVFSGLMVIGGSMALFALGRETEMVREMGLSSLMLGGLVFVLLCGTSTVVEERHTRTALPTLAKPVSRRCLVIGKFYGIIMAVALMLALLMIVLCAVLAAREGTEAIAGTGNGDAVESPLLLEVGKAALLTYFELALLAALVVGLSLFLSRLVSVAICLGLFTLGHLTDEAIRQLGIIAQGGPGKPFFEALPRLEYFRVATLVAERQSAVTAAYIGWAAIYAICGAAIVLLISMALYEKREIT